jgi:hypothetical protein
MRAAIAVKHHDHNYVEKRGGWELYTHLRAAGSRVKARREAIDRAARLYDAALGDDGSSDNERNGRGLIVLQRTLLALEDLGGLLHAFAGPDPWDRLRSATYDQMDAAFHAGGADPDEAIVRLGLASRKMLEEEGLSGEQIEAVWRMREFTAERWRRGLKTAATRWLTQRVVAKATMHGFPIISGPHVVGPPAAGELVRNMSLPDTTKFVMALVSEARPAEIETQRLIVTLDDSEVQAIRRDGRAAARLYGELCEMQSNSIEIGYAGSVPLRAKRWLSSHDQALVEEALRGSGQEDEESNAQP